LHDVSHELRSPLVRLQAAIGLARQRPEKQDSSLDRIEQEAVRLDRLVGELLTLSRLEVGMGGETDEAIDLADLVREVAEDTRFEAEATGRRVLFSGADEAVVTGRAEVLHRALENVCRNAVKFTPEGTTIEITLRQLADAERAVVTVSDRGPGVPDGELETIFEPFVRRATHRQTAGFGLGLAIARRAIETHCGSIRALNRPEGGLRIEITLPVSSGKSSAIDSRRALVRHR
jgi:two-component system OmpR family sensor kinase